jgi:hypothetical protein
MKRVFVAVLVAAACVVAATPGFARGGGGHGGGFANRGGFVRNPTTLGITSTADARFSKPDSGPTRGTFAGAGHQRAVGAKPLWGVM